MFKKITQDRRVQIILVLLIVVMVSFWSTSRYPSLDTKSMMAGSVSLADGLSFDAHIPHAMSDSTFKDIVVTFVNWLYTNKQGMQFGLIIAVLFMSLIPLIRDELDVFLTKRYSATLSGALLGAPLGVCVNCAAPIGYGMYRQGARLEAALATMISSPTMNVVVLSMAFTLFPVYIVVIKILAALFTILVVIPFLVGRFPDEATTKEPLENTHIHEIDSVVTDDVYMERNLIKAIKWVAVVLLKQAWTLLKQVVPIMLLAGFLGAAAVVLLPWDALVEYLPEGFSLTSIAMMLLLSIFGLLLPVPIAFDVVLAASLASAGVPIQYIAILLFVLGSFSIYSFMVLLKAKTKKVAWSMILALALVGVAAGGISKLTHDIYNEKVQAPLYEQLKHSQKTSEKMIDDMPEGLSGGVYQSEDDDKSGKGVSNIPTELTQYLSSQNDLRHSTLQSVTLQNQVKALPLKWLPFTQSKRIEQLKLTDRPQASGQFHQIVLKKTGLDHHFKPLVYNFINEFPDTNGVVSGDINNDGWFDLLFATPNGVYVYLNNGKKFELYAQLKGDNPLISLTGAAAIIDLNNDGWQDVIFSEHASGLWIAYNENGLLKNPIKLPDSNERFAKALAFLDLDGDGYLEIFSGNVSSLIAKRPSSELAQNVFYHWDGESYKSVRMNEPHGETLSIWLGDIDQDNVVDVLIGNDFDEPDFYYTLDDGFKFSSMHKDKIASSTQWTMSFDAADIDNDLDMEIYSGQTTWNSSSPPHKVQQANGVIATHCAKFKGEYCQLSLALAEARKALKIQDASLCDGLDGGYKVDCIAAVYFRVLKNSITPTADKKDILAKAELLKDKYPKLYQNFEHMLAADILTNAESARRNAPYVQQQKGINNLLILDDQGNFKNRSVEYGVDIGGWTWNARFADVDSDEWQDLYIANGWTPSELETTNVLYHNNQGKSFTNDTVDFGLLDFEPTIAYTYIDYDNDGDLDIISYSQVGRVAVFRNEIHENNNIQFELRDSKANFYGVGSKLIISYGEDGSKKQIREIKMSGGHLSFDPQMAHFGLGKWDSVSAVDVEWSTGEKETFKGPFKQGYRYKIHR